MAYTVGPFDSKHLYLQWGGKLPGSEQWSCGMRLMLVAPGDGDQATAPNMTAYTSAITTYHNAALTQIGAAAKLSFVKVNTIGTDGSYLYEYTNESLVADAPGGGSAIQPYPNQVALAVSLTTGFSRGAAHRGRFYLPLPSMPVDGNSLISAADAAFVATSTKNMITAVNAVASNFKVAVFSRKAGAATHRPVTGVDVGHALDTQRRRRRNLIENYSHA